ncbi:unnamed protein product [Scytosiphon promiscuus]
MWEEPSSGDCKFRARWLVRPADAMGKPLFSHRTRSALRRSADASRRATSPAPDPLSSVGASSVALEKGGERDGNGDNDDEEVFLTSRTEDLDLSSMKRLVVLCAVAVDAPLGVRAGAAWKVEEGPRLSHAFDDLTGKITPLESTDPIFARARSRRAEAMELASRAAAETASPGRSRPAVNQTIGWMPLKRSRRTAHGDDLQAVALALPRAQVTTPAPAQAQAPAQAPAQAQAQAPAQAPAQTLAPTPAQALPPEPAPAMGPAPSLPTAPALDSAPETSTPTSASTPASTPTSPSASTSPSISTSTAGSTASLPSIATPAPSIPAERSSERPGTRAIGRESGILIDPEEHQVAESSGAAKMVDGESGESDETSRGSPVSVSATSEGDGKVPGNAESREPVHDDDDSAPFAENGSAGVQASRSPSLAVDHGEEGNIPATTSVGRNDPPFPLPEIAVSPSNGALSLPAATFSNRFSPGSKAVTRSSTRSAGAPAARAGSARVPTPHTVLAHAGQRKPGLTAVDSTTGKRKRTVKTKKSAVGDGGVQSSDAGKTLLRPISVGPDHQASVPDMLPASTRLTGSPAEGAGDQGSAKLVWGSIRDWDPYSCGVLSGYLQAASAITRRSQSRPGVALPERPSARNDFSDGGAGQETTHNRDVHLAGPVTVRVNYDGPGVPGVAHNGHLRMPRPTSEAQRVQCEEEALKALKDSGCNLHQFEPALDEFSRCIRRESEPPWTVGQVRTLQASVEDSLQKGISRTNSGVRRMARPGFKLGREDMVDLAVVGKSVPGKTPAQVISFFYRYVAAARPPRGDRVHEPEATKAQDHESSPTTHADRGTPRASHSGPSTRISAGGESLAVGIVAASPEEEARRAELTTCSSLKTGQDAGVAPTSRLEADGEENAARSLPTEPEVLEVFDSDDDCGARLAAEAQEPSPPPRPVLKNLTRPEACERPGSPATLDEDDFRARARLKLARDHSSPQPATLRGASRTDDGALHGRQGRDILSGRRGEEGVDGFWGRSVDPSAQPVGTGDAFGFMSPCWRLLERARGYMDQDQLEYMRGLILAHARKPMSREQLLTRARSCLEELPHIWTAFVDTFDRLDEGSKVPLFERRRSAPSGPWVAAIPAPLAGHPPPDGAPPTVAWARPLLMDTGPRPFQHLPPGGAPPSKQASDFSWRSSRWEPRFEDSGESVATGEACGGDSLEVGGPWAQPVGSRWWDEDPAKRVVHDGAGRPWVKPGADDAMRC